MYKLFFGMFLLLITLNIMPVNASGPSFSIDKTLYTEGDLIVISGKVDYDPQIPFIILQVITPDGSGLSHIANILPKNDGSFKTTLKAGGPTWPNDGVYTIKISYIENLERQIDYKKSTNSQQNTSQQNTSHSDIESYVAETYDENPKLRILGFPSLDKSPQYYIDRYNSEPEYKTWFDSQFPDYSIYDVVKYSNTAVPNFPSLDKSPQYYIDRYNSEPEYKTWFDSQFPDNTIYDVLGFSTAVPEWIKTYAQNWAAGRISDSEFMTGLEFMLTNRIIVIPGFNVSDDAISDIPSWFRNTAHWWSQGFMSNQEFINAVKYLIIENIISVK